MCSIEMSPEIKDLAAALLTFQANVHGVVKDSKNPAFKSRYASLEAVVETSRPALQAANIAFMQSPGRMQDNRLEVTTMLIHAPSGQWMRGTMQIPLAKVDAQGAGSATTYAQRYSLMAMLGLPPVDDDGAEASRPAPVRQEEPRQPQPARQAAPAGMDRPEAVRDRLIETLRKATSPEDLAERANRDEEHFQALPQAMQADVVKVYRVVEAALS